MSFSTLTMSHGVLDTVLAPQVVGAQYDTIVRNKASLLRHETSAAADILAVQVCSQLVDVLPHEPNDGA